MVSKTSQRWRSSLLIVLFATILSACGGGATPPTNTNTTGTNGNIVEYRTAEDSSTLADYWSKERLLNATNLDLPELSEKYASTIKDLSDEVIQQNNRIANQAGGTPEGALPTIPSMKPEDLQELLRQLQQLQNAQGSAVSPAASVLNSLSALNTATYEYPLSTVGKVFFQDAVTGEDFVCSAAAMNSDNKSVVNTAGHCIFSNGSFVNRWIFCPMYYNGDVPLGCWAAHYFYITRGWANNEEDFTNDYGLVVVSPSPEYGQVATTVGGLGYLYGAGASRNFYSYGYPAADPFDGQSMRQCDDTGQARTYDSETDTIVVRIDCNMTGGSSGGPWLTNYEGDWYLNGHNSYGMPTTDPNAMYSPYYGDSWYNLYQQASATDPGAAVSAL